MKWIKDKLDPKFREWEGFYRSRWQHDKVIRSTHGVNCTGSCSWDVFLKDGIITWEMQATDYPLLNSSVPPYEPRGCQRGITASWYVYSPLRVKYPYVRGKLLDLWRKEKQKHLDPVKAWRAIQTDSEKRKSYQKARGKGGFQRASWEEVNEIIVASLLSTIDKYGPDRIFGFSPIPAMSYLSYAAGIRFLQLIGGVGMSFYDWYSDLPNALPETWGEQTDVAESADWFNAKYIIAMGSNISITRCPDAHFIHEARYQGTKFVVISPDFSAVAKNSDWWLPINAGYDTAFWMAINHVILKEFYVDKQVPYFVDYIKQYSDAPYIVELVKTGDSYKAATMLRGNKLEEFKNEKNGDWKLLLFDNISQTFVIPNGSIGHRWEKSKKKWNLKLENSVSGEIIDPEYTFFDSFDGKELVSFDDFNSDRTVKKQVPVKYIETSDGLIPVTTVFDLLMAHFGVHRGLEGDYPRDYNDADHLYSPAWQEKLTGIGRESLIELAKEFAFNAEATKGQSMVIIGTGINHWYHNNLGYRGPIAALILTGCIGKNGGGLNHYVGQEKATLIAPWANLAFALDWDKPPRLQQTPIWHYINSSQWRYEGAFSEYASLPKDSKFRDKHVADLIVEAVKMGHMPYFPQFNQNSLKIVKEAIKAGKTTNEEIISHIVNQLKNGDLKYSIEDPDAEENWPRIWFIWRANALMSSAKGHEYFLKHYLGTDHNIITTERAEEFVKQIKYRSTSPEGKMDLVVDLNFRMDTSALYSDIVLPAAMWYEKNDLNTTDLHTFIHPLGEAAPPAWEAKSDWEIFKDLARDFTKMAKNYYDEPIKDIFSGPLLHDTPDEIAQLEVKKWFEDECEAIPGKTMPNMKILNRDFTQVYNKFIAFGPKARDDGFTVHGVHVPIKKYYDALTQNPISTTPDTKHMRAVEWNGNRYPSVENDLDAANLILNLSPETNGDIAYDTYKEEEEVLGIELSDLASKNRSVRVNFEDITLQPRRVITSPLWSGIINDGRPYTGYAINIERMIPWRTLTGRQSLYLDHPNYIEFGENLPIYKPKLSMKGIRDVEKTLDTESSILLHFHTPHGKWQIHSTFYDNEKMRQLSRGVEPCWLHPDDAKRINVEDNDWVEVFNDNGVTVTRATVSSRIPKGNAIIHHSGERTISIPKAQIRGDQRAGVHNSLIRIRLNPVLLAGGYAQFSYGFNYWGPVGINRDTYVMVRKLEKVEF